MIVQVAIALWLFLTVVNVVGAVIGWHQLRTDPNRVSLYLSRILIAEGIRGTLAFVGVYYAYDRLVNAPIYVMLSLFSVTLLTGAIWGWLLYLRGLWNGGGWPEFLSKLRRTPDEE